MKENFLNPFEKTQETLLFAIGLASIVLGSVIGYCCNARFDGVIDLHFTENNEAYDALLDIVISIASATLVFYIIGRTKNPKTRLIDVFNFVSIAKIPFYVIAFVNLGNWIYNTTAKLMAGIQKSILEVPEISSLVPVLLLALLSIIALVISIVLSFNGYKVATNSKGNKGVWLFVLGLIISEIISKIGISFVF